MCGWIRSLTVLMIHLDPKPLTERSTEAAAGLLSNAGWFSNAHPGWQVLARGLKSDIYNNYLFGKFTCMWICTIDDWNYLPSLLFIYSKNLYSGRSRVQGPDSSGGQPSEGSTVEESGIHMAKNLNKWILGPPVPCPVGQPECLMVHLLPEELTHLKLCCELRVCRWVYRVLSLDWYLCQIVDSLYC